MTSHQVFFATTLLALSLACSRRGAEHGNSAPTATAMLKKSAPTSRDEILRPLLYGAVVLAKATAQHQPIGVPRLVFRRDDHDESFLAESDIDVGSLDQATARLAHEALIARGPASDLCRIEGDSSRLSVFSWAIAPDAKTGERWDDLPDAPLAREVFRHGNRFIVRVQQGCRDSMWAARVGAQLDVHDLSLSKSDESTGATFDLSLLPYSTDWQSEYESFRETELARTSNRKHQFPGKWFELPGETRMGLFMGKEPREYRITCFDRRVTAGIVGRFNAPPLPWFGRGGLAVWRKESTGGYALAGPLVRAFDAQLSCVSVGVVTVIGGPQLITFNSSLVRGALRQEGGRFLVADEYSIGPSFLAAL